jgi:hypothetical protein
MTEEIQAGAKRTFPTSDTNATTPSATKRSRQIGKLFINKKNAGLQMGEGPVRSRPMPLILAVEGEGNLSQNHQGAGQRGLQRGV